MLEELKNKYTNIKQISRGSTSIVYKAIDMYTGRRVVIKEFVYSTPDGSSESDIPHLEQWKRFKRETEIHSTVSHQNIIEFHKVYEVNSKLFLILDYVEAKSLQDLLEEKKQFNVFEVINIIKQVASALQYLHDNGIIHRDIKPGNILISDDGHVYLIDFGCARRIFTENLTTVRMIIGTINYMSPEQLIGDPDSIDGRADVFSIGCLFYQLLTGRMPFKGGNVRETINNIFQTHPAPLCNLNPVCPFKLEVIVHQTLKKDPDHRCTSAKQLIYYLDKLLSEPEIYYNQGDFYEKNGELKTAYSYYKQAIHVDENYFPAWKAISNLFYISEDWNNALEYYNYLIQVDTTDHLLYSKLGDVYVGLKKYPESLKMYQKAWILKPEEKNYELKMANSLFHCKKIEEAIECYLSIIERYKNWVQPKYELGILYYKIGKKSLALQVLENAKNLDPSNIDILLCLGSLYQEFRHLDKAIEVYYKLDVLSPDSPMTIHNLACAYYQVKDYKKAKEKLHQLISLGVVTTQSYILLGLIHEELEQPEEAINSYRKVISLDSTNIEAYLYLAVILRNQWRVNEAIDVLIEATKTDTKYSKAEVFYQLAETYREKGQFSDAKKAYKECIERSGPGKLFEVANRQLKNLITAERKHRKFIPGIVEFNQKIN